MTLPVEVVEASGVLDNPIVKQRVTNLVLHALDVAEEYLTDGTAQTRMTLIKALMPILVRSSKDEQRDDELDEMKREMGRIMEEVRNSGKGARLTVLGDGGVVEDKPHE